MLPCPIIIRKMVKRTKRWINKLNTAQIITLGFAGVIFVGAVLLWLPWSAADGQQTSFLDALFTATTSVCVTGLVTVTTATHWSLFGKVIILILIQLGGLGIIAVGTLIFMIMGKHIGIKSRKVIQESYNLDKVSGMVQTIRKVVKFCLFVEILGAVGYSFCFVPELGLLKGIGNGIFTAVSAFCNAGMDVLGEESLAPYVTSLPINLITMALIVTGGLGFTVWFDLKKNLMQFVQKKHSLGYGWRNLRVHSKLAITVTLLLLAAGTVLFMVFEYNNPDTIGNLSFGHKLLASAFQSVTTRTAGFLTIDQAAFTDASMITSVFLMLIGGSPMGTAGGMKTTTIAILVLTVAAYLRGKSDTEIFHRKIKDDNIRTAIVVTCIALLAFVVALVTLSINMDAMLGDLTYEVASALGTVGLTRGITPLLSSQGKIVIIICMYLGRIGPITLATAITVRAKHANKLVHLAEERVLIG